MTKLLFIAIMYTGQQLFDICKNELISKYDAIFAESNSYDFNFTDYYEKEMGKHLKKKFLIFKKEISKEDLIQIKLKTTDIEKKFSEDNKRKINIDPGYLSNNELVLATFKQKDFKEKLSDKIWVHKVLEFKQENVKTFFHTFADYKLKENQEFIVKNKPK